MFLLLLSQAALAINNTSGGTQSIQQTNLQNKLVQAASGDIKFSFHKETGQVSFITLGAGKSIQQPFNGTQSTDPEIVARNFLTEYGGLFGIKSPADGFRTLRVRKNRDGKVSTTSFAVKFQQVYKGIPVFGGEMVVRLDAKTNVTGSNGETSQNLMGLDVNPKVSMKVAQQNALKLVAKYKKRSVSDLLTTPPELWIYNPALVGNHGDDNTLVWRMDVKSKQSAGDIRELVLVDAINGNVVLHYNQIHHAKNRRTYDRNNVRPSTSDVTEGLPGTLMRVEGQGPVGIADVNNAHDFAGDTYDFYLTNHARDSLDGAGMTMISTVRYCTADINDDCPLQNAFWNGSQMVYGVGFTVDDVVGHELTHAVTQKESGLLYFNESGAINESFSDVWGEFVDLTNGKGNDSLAVRWQMGEDSDPGTLRNMKNPTLFNDPDKTSSANYHCALSDNGGVHVNSGVNNKAVYLMVDGGTFNGKTVTGLGIPKVAKIYYEAQTNILTSGSNYLDLYNALRAACNNLVGTSGITAANCVQVTNALQAVEMNQPPVCDIPPAPVCDSGSPVNIFFDNLENGSGNWTHSATLGADAWVTNETGNAASGTKMIHGYDRSQKSDSSIQMTSSIVLPANAFMHFKHAFEIENNYDGGVIEYSLNNGASWIDAGALIDRNGYQNMLNNTVNPLDGRNVFSGSSHGYTSTRLALGALGGQSVKFRFRMGTDNSVGQLGWSIDDVRIYRCVVNDQDHDGVPDSTDNCPTIPNANQANFDGDSLGDVCDPDDDNDGMTDAWENSHGLNSKNAGDRNQDPDGDGFTNFQEFKFGTDPHVHNPDDNGNGIPDSIDAALVIMPLLQLILD
jgi:Zn-dependent metalloprotease